MKKKADEIPRGESVSYLVAAAALILITATLLSITVNLPHIFIIALAGVALRFFFRISLPFNDRSIIYSFVLCFALAVISDIISPMEKSIGNIIPPNIAAPLLLFLAITSLYFESNPYVTGFCASFCLAVTMIGCDIMYNAPSLKKLPIPISGFYNEFFTVAIACSVILILLMFQFCGHYTLRLKSFVEKRRKRSIFFSALLFSMVIAAAAFILFKKYERQIRLLDNFFVRVGMMRHYNPKYLMFSKEANLNRPFNQRFERNKNKIVIRAVSESAPGYLRGRVYTNYDNGIWRDAGTELYKMQLIKNEDILTYNTFEFPGNAPEKKTPIRFFQAKDVITEGLLVPECTSSIDIMSDRVNYTDNGIIIPDVWDQSAGWTAWVRQSSPDSSCQLPSGTISGNFSSLPKNIEEEIEKYIKSSVMPETDYNQLFLKKDREIIDALDSYFSKNFKYAIPSGEANGNTDPLMNFLSVKSGHCELFATATTLMLRKFGIPARYVTGFICEEAHPSGKYYIARLANAHAWVEAYLRDEKKWVLVDTTPASARDAAGHKWGVFETAKDWLGFVFKQALSDIKKGLFARAVTEFFSSLFSAVWALIGQPLRGSLLVIIILFSLTIIKVKKAALGKNPFDLPEETLKIFSEFQAVEKFLTKKSEIKRSPGETVEEWAVMINFNNAKIVSEFNLLLENYNRLRYSQKSPEKNEVAAFRNICRKFIRTGLSA